MATRKEVAGMAGVSEATVSNVINGNVPVKEEKRQRVLQAIKNLKYVPDQTARNLVTRRSNHIGIAIYETTNPYHTELAKEIEGYAIKKGYIVSLFMLDNNMEHKLDAITRRRFDGIVNFMTNAYPSDFIELLLNSGTILINFEAKYGSTLDNNFYDATADILCKVKEYGHERIAYLTSQDESGFAADSRGRAFFDKTAELGFKETRVFYNDDFNRKSDHTGFALGKKIIKEFPDVTAIMCINDLAAMGCIRALSEAGISVPRDVSVTGCDDIDVAKIIVPSLTTISVDKRQVGKDIAKQIISELSGGARVHKIYTAKPVYRESLGICAKKASKTEL